jgi:dipeptidyl aminopeptidase/acylaminoacyl peptidase
MKTRFALLVGMSFTALVAGTLAAQQKYERPPQAILDVLEAPPPALSLLSPPGNVLLLATPGYYPPISVFAQPLLRLAGVRINPRNNGVHGARYYLSYAVKTIPDGAELPVKGLPVGARLGLARWNATGTAFAFTVLGEEAVELWTCEVATATAHRVEGIRVNPVLGDAVAWMPDERTLLVKVVPDGRTQPPAEPAMAIGPRIEESGGGAAPSSTYEARDLLRNAHDGDLFEYYASAQLALVDAATGKVTKVGAPAVLAKVLASPSGKYVLVERIARPYSLLRPYDRFPSEVEVWSLGGEKVETLASEPLAEQVPIHGVRVGPREHEWRATAPATVVWAEALDGGDTYRKVAHHDRVMAKPVGQPASTLVETEQRFEGADWLEHGGRVLITEYNDDKHWLKTSLLDADRPSTAARVVWNRSSDDRYGDPGVPVLRTPHSGTSIVGEQGGAIFLVGQGASPDGNRPFLDRLDVATLRSERLFRSGHDHLETFLGWTDAEKGSFLTNRQSPTEPPNAYLRTLGGRVAGQVQPGEAARTSTSRAVTHFTDPTPQLRQLSRRLVTYARPDGVKLSFTLYLPPGYQPGTRLPTVLWAYPLDYTDPTAAGQVNGSPLEFTTVIGASPVFLALAGYAVLDQTAMPVVGPTETVYDTFIEQIIANAKAAIDKAVELGVTDRDRVAVMGQSHGALMTANLLAWSDLFRAGVARSGAYNHTLRPFGFQNERRTLYQAADTYLKLSPLLHADRIRYPLLLIHGERDANPGTVPLQSEKLYEALRGVGGTTRLVVLPLESHGYAARESVEQTLYEMVRWCDLYVKNAGPRAKTKAAAASHR